ncbi:MULTISPECIES: alpha/beta hydrolase family protein [Pseudomonas]|uniref:Alpha/beta hydrolase n=1 Tax=Pseudomonas gingeri TaxID=117681 RepID=A0A7Y7WXA6_9PSED|nr:MULTISPECIES: alpha/beta hydrolase [Pseudomonas]MPQ69617.1 alpha/beta hydrolase [Pseudomonas sp. MWU12-2323]NWB89414.1 alpha/beta hydrolase [Pseudomonas gingeri]
MKGLNWGLFTFLCALLGILAGCADPNRHAETLAHSAHLQREQVDTDSFVLTSFYRITRPDLPLNLYIEGDGLAWRSRTTPSENPTPHQAEGLALAAADPGPNVVYLARPCQFTPLAISPRCDKAYWTQKRFAEDVVVAMNQAVSHFALQVPGQRIHLVGYSGGAALAVLIAARRSDIASLRTVAGNLDHAEVNRLHQVSAMPESLNAIDVARQVASIPQLHFSGGDDSVVPPVIARRFVSATAGVCAYSQIVPGMGHESDWARLWPQLLLIALPCSSSR